LFCREKKRLSRRDITDGKSEREVGLRLTGTLPITGNARKRVVGRLGVHRRRDAGEERDQSHDNKKGGQKELAKGPADRGAET